MLSRLFKKYIKVLVVLFGVVLMTLLVGRNHFVLGTGLIFFRWIFLALGGILLYGAHKRGVTRSYLVLLLLVLVCVVGEYTWTRFTREGLKENTVDTELSLMTYNVFFRNASPALSIENMKKVDPDVLLVQELTPEWKTALENAIGGKYPYRRTQAIRGTHGIGVYAKYPILKSDFLDNESGRPYAQVVELKVHNKKVQVINVHLASPAVAVEDPKNFMSHYDENYDQRRRQLSEITRMAQATEKQFDVQLALGDFNTTSFEPIYRDFKMNWVNLYDEAGDGLGLSFPNSSKTTPLLTLDYMFARGSLQGVSMEVIEGGSSDHLAVAGKIRI